MSSAFLTGFFLGISLILVIGAQNAFVLRQGILGKHVFYVALFCSISDAFLICIGVVGVSFFFNNFISEYTELLFGFSALWLFIYGVLRFKAVFKSDENLEIESSPLKGLGPTLTMIGILTFANPHVYLDTMLLIGSVSQQFSGNDKISFTLGASMASFVFFFCLAYGAKLLAPKMKSTSSWRILDFIIAIIMFNLSFKLAVAGNLL